jgi:phosphocarrier protein FPr
LDPAVLQLIDLVCRAAEGRCLVSVCGELAADPTATAFLVTLGVRELSVAPTAVPASKQAVRAVTSPLHPDVVSAVLAADSPQAVRTLLT